VKTILLLALFALAGCVSGAPMPMEATDAPSTSETPRLRRHWMESDRRETALRTARHRREPQGCVSPDLEGGWLAGHRSCRPPGVRFGGWPHVPASVDHAV
jgi:hypothetical protein